MSTSLRKSVVWYALLFSAASLYAADKKEPLLDKKENSKQSIELSITIPQQNKTSITIPGLRLYNQYIESQKEYLPLAWCFLQQYPQHVPGELTTALTHLHKKAVEFYAPYAGDLMPLLKSTITSGHIDQVKLLLPALQHADLHGYVCDAHELPYPDLSGLAFTAECKDEKVGLEMVQAIVDFYKPTREECDSVWCTPCKAQCQKRRKAFIIYGASKALENAAALKKSEHFISHFLTLDPYISREALAAAKKYGAKLETFLHHEQSQQHSQQSSALLAGFGCVQKGPDDQIDYPETLAYPVLRNKKPRPHRSCLHSKKLCPK